MMVAVTLLALGIDANLGRLAYLRVLVSTSGFCGVILLLVGSDVKQTDGLLCFVPINKNSRVC